MSALSAQAEASPDLDGCHDYVPIDHGNLRVRRDYLPLFDQFGWLTVEAVMRTDRCDVFRTVGGRTNGCVALIEPQSGRPVLGYLKRHCVRHLPGRRGERDRYPGWSELESAARCVGAGVPTMQVIAAGRRQTPDGHESFFLSEAIADGVPADAYWTRRFGTGSVPTGDRSARRRVLAALADTARRLHAAGLFHRDLYWCHFFVREQTPNRPAAHLIDLQRLCRPGWRQWRWRLKDLAQFWFSAPPGALDGAEGAFWFACYRGVDSLGLGERLWLAAVRWRSAFYRFKDGSNLPDW